MNIATYPLRADFLAVANANGQRKADKPNLPVPGRAVTRALRIVPAANATRLDDDEKGVAATDTLGGPRPSTIVSVTPPSAASVPVAATSRTSWSLAAVAFGFFGLGVAINVWNAMAGDIATTALPATMGVLAEAAAFLIPARLVGLPAARRTLGIAILVFVSAFALTNSLRMASIVAADTAAARADRQTEGTKAADMALDAARKARDEACGRGQGKTVACQTRVQDVTKAEAARSAAGNRVASQARPESGDFARLVTWLSRGTVTPGADDFAMLWLLFRTVMPAIGGLVLMLARK